VFFQVGALAISLFPRRLLAEDAGAPADGHGFSGITLAHNVREPADVERLFAITEAAGGRITKPAQDAFWGGRTGCFADPDGHLWEVAWNPHFTLTEEEALRIP
jgi:uncharacterized glyoxalase superfamily protein PhnB